MKSRSTTPKLQSRVFYEVAKIRRNVSTTRPFGTAELTERARAVAARQYDNATDTERRDALSHLQVEDRTDWIRDVAHDVAVYIQATFDKSRMRRLPPKTTRADRQRRDDAIVADYKLGVVKVRDLAVRHNVSAHTVTRALHGVNIAERRQAAIAKLPKIVAFVLTNIERSALVSGVTVFPREDIDKLIRFFYRYIQDEIDLLSIYQIRDVINNSSLDVMLLLYADQFVIFSRSNGRSASKIINSAERIINNRFGVCAHKFRNISSYIDNKLEVCGLGYILHLVRQVDYRTIPVDVLEKLWFISFNFTDRERVRYVLHRASNERDYLDKIKNYFWRESSETVSEMRRALDLTHETSHFKTQGDALVCWVNGSDLRQILTDSEVHAIDKLAAIRQDEYTLTENIVLELLANAEPSIIIATTPILPSVNLVDAQQDAGSGNTDYDVDPDEDDYERDHIRRQLDDEIQEELGPRPFDADDCEDFLNCRNWFCLRREQTQRQPRSRTDVHQ